MKTQVCETSLNAYYNPSNAKRRPEQRERVYQYIVAHPNCINSEIALALGLDKGTVAARRNELVAEGVVVIGETRNGAKQVRAVEAQGELFH